jgi:predicted lipid-binding transport protein (Tim44 family)
VTAHLRSLPLAVAFAAALALGGCGGGGDDEGPTDSPEAVLEELQEAAEDGDGERLCALFTSNGIDNIEENRDGEDCEDQVEAGHLSQHDDVEDVADFEVVDVDESGDEAEATVEFDGEEEAVELVEQGGEWKIDESFP